jgi:hypothetical protein
MLQYNFLFVQYCYSKKCFFQSPSKNSNSLKKKVSPYAVANHRRGRLTKSQSQVKFPRGLRGEKPGALLSEPNLGSPSRMHTVETVERLLLSESNPMSSDVVRLPKY